MLPLLSNMKTTLIAASVALTLAATSTTPAAAWTRPGQWTPGDAAVAGVATGLLLGYLITENNRPYVRPAPVYQAPYQPIYRPVYPGYGNGNWDRDDWHRDDWHRNAWRRDEWHRTEWRGGYSDPRN